LAVCRRHTATGAAFPQKSKSTFPHQERVDESQLVLFCRMKRKISSSPRAGSIFSFSLFFARPPSFGTARLLFLLRDQPAAVPVSAARAAGKLRRTLAAAC